MQLTTPGGQRVTAAPGLFRLRITPAGGTAAERRGFCVDAHHAIGGGTDYSVSLRTAADEPLLASAALRRGRLARPAGRDARGGGPGERPRARGRRPAGGRLAAHGPDPRDARPPTTPPSTPAPPPSGRSPRAGPSAARSRSRAATPRGCAGRSAVPLRLTGRPGQHRDPDRRGRRRRRQPGAGALRRHRRRGRGGHVRDRGHRHRPGPLRGRHPHPRGARQRGREHAPGDDLPRAGRRTTASTSVVFEDCPVIPLDPRRHSRGPSRSPTAPARRSASRPSPPAPRPARRHRAGPTRRAPSSP